MYRASNSVSVIEILPEDEWESTSPGVSLEGGVNIYSSFTVNDTPSVRSTTDSVALNLSKTQTTESSQSSSVLLIDKVEFKQKMKDILSCRVCSELRRSPMYQCKYGHLICAGCFNDILAESQLQNEIASCPQCQATITKELCFRNVAVEKTISELPITCAYCSNEYPPESFKYHENLRCKNRPSVCSNSVIGCLWQGPIVERPAHEEICKQPSASGYEILSLLTTLDEKHKEGMNLYSKIMELLSVEKISYVDLQLKYLTTEIEVIMFETSKFSAFENQWVIQAFFHNDLAKSTGPSFQLIVKTKLTSPMNLQYILLKGPFNDMEIKPKICQFTFSDKSMESPYHVLDVPNVIDKKSFQSAKRINIRILMFVSR